MGQNIKSRIKKICKVNFAKKLFTRSSNGQAPPHKFLPPDRLICGVEKPPKPKLWELIPTEPEVVSNIGRRLNSSWTCGSLKVLKTFGWGVRGAPQKFPKFCKQKKYTAVFYAAYAYGLADSGSVNGDVLYVGQALI